MDAVRAKFQVQSVKQVSWDKDARVVELFAVTTGSEENKAWSKLTPSGNVTLTITNPPAAEWFTLGKEVYLDFTSA